MSGAQLARERDRRRTRYAGVAVTALLFMNCVALVLGPSSGAQTAARLDVLKPAIEVAAGPEADFDAVSGGRDLDTGSRVRTSPSGSAEISFADGSLTRLGPDTTYTLTTLQIGAGSRQIVGRLDIGRSFHRVSKTSGSRSRFEVQTSKAIAAVRGTAFHVDCLVADTCEVAVVEGIVAVTTADGASVDLTAGQRVVIGSDGALQPVEVAPASSQAPPPPTTSSSESPAAPAEPPVPTADGAANPAPSAPTSGTTPASTAPIASTSQSVPVTAPATTPKTATTSTTATLPPTSAPTVPPTTLPVEIPPLCPGYQGDPQRPGECLPCEVGGVLPINPNCP